MTKAMKIGELAKATGLTVRTLHHYDDIGLLKPSGRTDSGHRLYYRDDIKRLQTILSLQCLHFSLKDIKITLDNEPQAFEHALNNHIEQLEAEIGQKQALFNRLSQIKQQIGQGESLELETLIQNIEVIVMYEKYYTQEQLDSLKQREAKLSEEEKQAINKQWMDLFAAFEKAHAKGIPVDDPSVVKLGEKANEYVGAFTGGDPEMQESHQKMYSTEGGSNVLAQHGVTLSQEVFDYMAQAMGHAKSRN